MNQTPSTLPPDYAQWLTSLKQRIRGARQRALLSANAQQIRLYHDSPDFLIGQQSADQLPWFHIVPLITKLTDPVLRDWYGLLLFRTQNRLVAEYALSKIDKPIGVAEYQLVRTLPEPLDTSLPSIEKIETEFAREMDSEDLA